MGFKLAVDDVIGVKVQGKYTDKDGADKSFKFVLFCERRTAQQMKDAVADQEETVVDFLAKYARDWKGQTLVLEEDNSPAAFSPDSLRALLSISGMAALCWHSYVQQVQATVKN